MPATSLADPFDAGPYGRLDSAVGLARAGIRTKVPRAAAVAAIAWVPLFVLSAAEGLARGPDPRASLLLDLSAYARYLVALPVLVLASAITLPRLAAIARQFLDAGIVAEADRPRFEALIRSTRRLLALHWVGVVLVIAAYAATMTLSGQLYPATVSTWVTPIRDGVRELSLAGWWRAVVSQPLFLLAVNLWLWRLAVWTRFVWATSRLRLQLVPAHPDHAGGLHFVATSLPAFMPVAFAIGVVAAGTAGEAILFGGRLLSEFYMAVGVLVAGVVLAFAGPLLPLAVPMCRAKINGIFAYGQLAEALGLRFERRWLRPAETVDDDALSAQDFSATTDLYSIVANTDAMRLLPVGLQGVGALVVAVLVPFVPLLLAILPLNQALRFAADLVL